MKQLRHVLYVTEPDIALKVEDQVLCAVRGNGEKEKIPFHLLERFARNHPGHSTERLEQSCRLLLQEEERLARAAEAEQLLGIEGAAAKAHYKGFGAMILADSQAFSFTERNRRPPKDRCNAMLSFAYTLLAQECVQALECVGLDPYVGVLRRERPGKHPGPCRQAVGAGALCAVKGKRG